MTSGERDPSYRAAIQFLYELSWFGFRPGLQTTLKLAAQFGNPHERLRFIHVAGTNGKGSTCAMLESIYRAAGLRVGLFTSPHLVSFRERIQINRQMIPESDVVRLVDDLRGSMQAFSAEEHPTFFEAVTLMALRYFAEQHCDLVIWETGLGGRLDATNIVTPLASVITNIQFDHQQWLGETLASIAGEKAGIIKPRVPVITGAEQPEALEVIAKIAVERQAPLTVVNSPTGGAEFGLPLLGEHQRRNAALASAAVNVLHESLPITPAELRVGLAAVEWPGRLQVITRPSGQKLILDGAHNVDGAAALARSLEELFPAQRPALILGILRDKDWAGMFRELAPLAGKIRLVSVQSERTASPEALAENCRSINSTAEVVCCDSLSEALAASAQEKVVVIAGSLYLIGEALELLDLTPTVHGERGLNEWTATAPEKKP